MSNARFLDWLEISKHVFKDCPGLGLKLGSFGFHLLSLNYRAPLTTRLLHPANKEKFVNGDRSQNDIKIEIKGLIADPYSRDISQSLAAETS